MQRLVPPEHNGSGRNSDLDDIFGLEPLLPTRPLLDCPEVRTGYDERHPVPRDRMVTDVPAHFKLKHGEQAVVGGALPLLLVVKVPGALQRLRVGLVGLLLAEQAVAALDLRAEGITISAAGREGSGRWAAGSAQCVAVFGEAHIPAGGVDDVTQDVRVVDEIEDGGRAEVAVAPAVRLRDRARQRPGGMRGAREDRGAATERSRTSMHSA